MYVFGAGGRWRRDDGWVSSCYGERRPAPVYVYAAEGTGAQEFVTLLVPRRAGEPAARVREVGGAGVRAYEVTREGVRDLLIFSGGVLTEPVALDTDFELACVRLGGAGVGAEELILIGGRRLSLDGRAVFTSEARAAHVYARREADGWRVEAAAEARGADDSVTTKNYVWD